MSAAVRGRDPGDGADAARRRARTLIGIGAGGVAFGISFSVLDVAQAGAVITVASLLALVAGIHRFGRTGVDRPPRAKRRRRAA